MALEMPEIGALPPVEQEAFLRVAEVLGLSFEGDPTLFEAMDEMLLTYYAQQGEEGLVPFARQLLDAGLLETLAATEDEEGQPLAPETIRKRRALLEVVPVEFTAQLLAYLAYARAENQPEGELLRTALFSPSRSGPERVIEGILAYKMAGGDVQGTTREIVELLSQARQLARKKEE